MKKNIRMIVYLSVFVVFLAAYSIYFLYQRRTAAENQQNEITRLLAGLPQQKMQIVRAQAGGADVSLMLMQSATELETLAKTTKNDAVAATALIKQAETVRTEFHYRMGQIEPQELASQMERVKQIYVSALARCENLPTLAAIAKMGIGLCEEESGNFDAARKIYQEVAGDAKYAGTTGAAAAGQRLEEMDYYKADLTFMPAPVQPQVEMATPQIQIVEPNAMPLFEYGEAVSEGAIEIPAADGNALPQ